MVFSLKSTPHVHSILFLILLTPYKTIYLKKTFDTVVHVILLNHYDIRGIINDWFASYFLGRSQITEVDSYLSSKSQIPCMCCSPRLRVRPIVILYRHHALIFITLPMNYHSIALLMTLTFCMQTKI